MARRRGGSAPVINPATEETIGAHACASEADLDDALMAAESGFRQWRRRLRVRSVAPAASRRRASAGPRRRCGARHHDGAGQAAGRIARGGRQLRRPDRLVRRRGSAGLRAASSPGARPTSPRWWSRSRSARSPPSRPGTSRINQAVRKSPPRSRQAARSSSKGPEETPASCAALVAVFADAGLPAGALNLVFGDPAAISAYLIPHATIRKISFTGSTAVGKRLAALAGRAYEARNNGTWRPCAGDRVRRR